MDKVYIVIIVGIIQFILISGMIWYVAQEYHNNGVIQIQNDLNILKSNDSAFAQYIVQNSQTLEYLNKNCKVTSDNNEVTVLTCIKVKA